ncbi:MAG: hypothetical protein IJW83_01770 [Clostridia bacterium]|nr:hypothetical protein [Clostridia bacterium]
MKRCTITFISICLIFLLSGCTIIPSDTPETDVTPSDGKTISDEYPDDLLITPSAKLPITDLVHAVYTDEELTEIFEYIYANDVNILELNEQYPMECVRWLSRNEKYRVSYLGEETVFVVFFSSDGSFDWSFAYSMGLSQEVLDEIRVGDSRQSVQEKTFPCFIDDMMAPDCISYHVTHDGYMYEFLYEYYDDGWKVAHVLKVLL